jgi:hypothetical protein
MILAFSGHDRVAVPLWLCVVALGWLATVYARRIWQDTESEIPTPIRLLGAGVLGFFGVAFVLAGIYGTLRAGILGR